MLRCLVLFLLSSLAAEAARVKRVKAGMKYKEHDPVHVVVNKVGPFTNPTETYRYYSLPFCHLTTDDDGAEDGTKGEKREGALKHRQRLGESIVGDRRETSPYDISFLDPIDWRSLCKKTLTSSDLKRFKEAIHNNYFFEMFVEDLPMWVSFAPGV